MNEKIQLIVNRTDDVVGPVEFGRRLAQALQLPQTYAKRLSLAYDQVITDALEHGEGIRFHKKGAVRLVPLSERHKQGFYQGQLREVRWKFQWKTTQDGLQFLKDYTRRTYGDISKTEDTELQVDTGGDA